MGSVHVGGTIRLLTTLSFYFISESNNKLWELKAPGLSSLSCLVYFLCGAVHDEGSSNILSYTCLFSLSSESWRILDLTVAMAYSMISVYGKQNRSISAAAAVLRGYHSVYPLTDSEREHLLLFTSVRLATSVTLGAYSFSQNPGNTYLLLHAEPAWNALELLWGYYDTDERTAMVQAVNKLFDQACSQGDGKADWPLPCGDLTLPDPSIEDLLASVRTAGNSKRKKTG